MEIWIWISIAAALFQTLRFMLQKQLASGRLSVAGSTFARFVFSAPLVIVVVALYGGLMGYHLPALGAEFFPFAMVGGLAQILATLAVVALFASRNFAAGITFKKTEVILTALVGFAVLGDRITLIGFVALLIGLLGVILLSDPPENAGTRQFSILNRSAGLGVLSGVFFAVSAVSYRGATLAVDSEDFIFRAGVTLAFVSVFQTLVLGVWLALREPGQIGQTLQHWRTTGVVGLMSMLGSYSWFMAFTLQSAAYVFAVGQIEVIFSFLVGIFIFHERSSKRELTGITAITLSILVLVLFG